MLIRRFGLFDDMSSLFHGFDSLLHEIGEESVLPSARLTVTSQPAPALEGWRRGYPAVETFRRDGEFVIRAELPGVDPGEVQVTVDDDQLRLRGERKQEQT